MMRARIKQLFIWLNGLFLGVCLWQLEILEWCRWKSEVYNFGGLIKDADIHLWSWRDFWFFCIFLDMIGLLLLKEMKND